MEALNTSADVTMLDNMSNEVMKKCVELTEGKKKLEASGNMELKKLHTMILILLLNKIIIAMDQIMVFNYIC